MMRTLVTGVRCGDKRRADEHPDAGSEVEDTCRSSDVGVMGDHKMVWSYLLYGILWQGSARARYVSRAGDGG